MAVPDPELLELAALVRGALILADRQRRFGVAADLDTALLKLVALDASGTIQPHPFDLNDDQDEGEQVPASRSA